MITGKSTKRSSSQKTRMKILRVSEKTFAEKGFEAARVDVIAKKADVNKALIYYYFDSKENLLQEVINHNAAEIRKGIEKLYQNLGKEKTVSEHFFQSVIEQLSKRKNILKILMYEVLSPGKNSPLIFKILDMTVNKHLEMLEEAGMPIKSAEAFKLKHFFYNMMPAISFILLGDKYAKNYEMDPKDAFETFISVFKNVKSKEIDKHKKH